MMPNTFQSNLIERATSQTEILDLADVEHQDTIIASYFFQIVLIPSRKNHTHFRLDTPPFGENIGQAMA